MNAARNLVPTGIHPAAIDRAPSEIAETPLRAHQRRRLALPRKRGSEQHAPKRGGSINMARYSIASRTAQK